jgi:TorA maturation chaperone TorD
LVNTKQTAQARSHTYTLFGRLFLEGLTEPLLPYAQAVAELAPLIPGPFSPNEAAATHHHLFAFNLFPYETIFLDSSGLLGGERSQAVANRYSQVGFIPGPSAPAPDHLGHQLLCLAYLLSAEASTNRPAEAHQWQKQQHDFLSNHLLRWLIPCTIALQQLGQPFYATLAQLTLALTADHYATLSTPFILHPSSFILPGEPPSLDDPQTRLRPIIHYLLTPCQSGLYLTRHDIEKVAQQLQLPRGFGRREEMLRNLWEAAVQYDQLPALLDALQNCLHQWQTAYQILDEPTLAPFLHPWQTRLHHSQQWLTTIWRG